MTRQQIARLGKELIRFLALFAGCFRSRAGIALCQVYVKGLLSNVQRKNVEAMALEFGEAPRTLQRFVESIKAIRVWPFESASLLWPFESASLLEDCARPFESASLLEDCARLKTAQVPKNEADSFRLYWRTAQD